jgi:hypothetical protein
MCLLHKWKVSSKDTHLSGLEQMLQYNLQHIKGLDDSAYVKPVIVTYTCSKCGAGKVVRL